MKQGLADIQGNMLKADFHIYSVPSFGSRENTGKEKQNSFTFNWSHNSTLSLVEVSFFCFPHFIKHDLLFAFKTHYKTQLWKRAAEKFSIPSTVSATKQEKAFSL